MATRIGTAFVDVKGDFTQLNQGVAAALAPTKLGKFGKVAGVAAGAAFAGGIAAAGIGKLAYDLGAEFDKAFDKIRVGTGKTGKPLKQLERDFKAVFSSVPTDAENAATAIAGLSTRLDLTGKPLRRMSKNMLELSRMTETDLGGNIQSVTRLFGDWGVQTEKQIPTLNKLWRAHQKTGVGIKDLSDLMVQFGSPLRNLGFDFDTAAAMFSKFEKEGVNVQTAMPGLRMALKNFAKDGKDPQKALMATFEAIDKAGSTAKANTIAFDTFGTRAGPDLAAAVREGRFEFDDIIKSMRDGKSTIMDTSNDTRDFGENMNKFGNKLKVIFEPLGTLVYNSVGKLSAALADLPLKKYASEIQKFTKHNQDFKDVLKAVRVGLKAFGEVARVAFSIMKEQFKAAWTYVKGAMQVMRGVIKVTSGVLTGDWSKAWEGVKDIFRGSVKVVLGVLRGMTAPVRKLASLVGGVLGKVFSGAWDRVEGIFETGANAVISVVNKIIAAINAIPGLPDIDHVGSVGGGPDLSIPGKGYGRHQRGALITGGKPSGDSVPALLERGEYVLNREAVKKVGVQNLDHLNFKKAARFQTGGAIGEPLRLNVGGAISGAANAVAGAAGNVIGRGAGYFIDKLPKPNIPEPFTGVGPYVVDAAKDYIKDKVRSLLASSGSNAASYPGLPGGAGSFEGTPVASWIVPILTWARNHGWGGALTSGIRTPEHNATIPGASPTSNHLATAYPGGAIDVGGFTARAEGQALASVLAGYPGHPTLVWGGPVMNDWGHFSATGHQRGGLIGRLRRMMVGGAAEHGVVRRVGADLLSHGFDFKSTAGILGNAWREGLWNPSQMEMTGADNGGLWGFTAYEKSLANLRAYAESKGKRWDDEIVQTHFMMKTGGNSIKGALNALDSIPETTKTFMDEYEIPASETAALDIRTSAAYDAAKILQAAGITKPGDEAGGGSGPSAAEAKKDAAQGRKSKRKGIISKLQDSLKGKVGGDRVGTLWDIIGAYAKYGKFEGSEKSMLLGQAGAAARAKSPVVAANTLDRVRKTLGDLVEVSGESGTNDSLFNRLKDIKAKGSAIAGNKRDRIFSKIRKNGSSYPFKDKMLGVDGHIAQLAEQLDIAEQLASFEGGPGGSELTEAERVKQVYLNKQILGEQTKKSGWLNKAIAVLYGKETGLSNQVAMATPKGSKSHWKLAALKKAMKETRGGINELGGYRETLVGVTGQGGELFDTQMRLKNLGVASTVESASAAARDSELASLMREQLGLAARNNAILSAQMPIYTQFMPKYHSGGVIPGAGEQPIMAMGGEGVFTRDQMAAIGGGSPTVVIEIAPGAGVDPAMIDARINGQLVKTVRRTRTGNAGAQKYNTAGLR